MSEELKTWILLREDCKTPKLFTIFHGGRSLESTSTYTYCIVKARDRTSAKSTMNELIRHLMPHEYDKITIMDPMIVEVRELVFTPPTIIYD